MSITKPDARWPEAVIVTIALWAFVLLIYLPQILDRHAGDSWLSVALDLSTLLLSVCLALAMFPLFRIVSRWRMIPRLAALGSAVLVASVAQTAFDLLYTGWVAQNLESSWHSLPRDLSRGYSAAFNYACVFIGNLTLYQLMFTRHREVRRERQLAEARWAAQQAQLTALRYQINPHFLFNTLNAISSMIVTRRNEDAEQMTDKLSTFLRASLSSDPTELVALEAELALIEEYLEIESIRFGDRLSVDIHCMPEAGEVLVPSFLLQPLVENAVKYGVGPSVSLVTIAVAAAIEGDELVIKVRDDGRASDDYPKPAGAGVGLENVRRRLEAVFGARASLHAVALDPGFGVTIRLPADGEPVRLRPA